MCLDGYSMARVNAICRFLWIIWLWCSNLSTVLVFGAYNESVGFTGKFQNFSIILWPLFFKDFLTVIFQIFFDCYFSNIFWQFVKNSPHQVAPSTCFSTSCEFYFQSLKFRKEQVALRFLHSGTLSSHLQFSTLKPERIPNPSRCRKKGRMKITFQFHYVYHRWSEGALWIAI